MEPNSERSSRHQASDQGGDTVFTVWQKQAVVLPIWQLFVQGQGVGGDNPRDSHGDKASDAEGWRQETACYDKREATSRNEDRQRLPV